MRRGLSLFALLLAFSLVVAACGDDDASETSETTAAETTETTTAASTETTAAETTETTAAAAGIEGEIKVLLHQNPPLVEYMEDFNSRFEDANPGVTVSMEIVNSQDMPTAIQTRLTAGEVDVIDFCAPPCASFSNPVQDYMSGVDTPLWQQLIEAGLVADLSNEAFIANWDQNALAAAGSYNGSVYALPAGRVSTAGMFVNEDLLADNGLEIPTTWGEFTDACDVVIAAGNSCMTLGGADGWPIFVGSFGLLGAFFPDQAGLVEGLWTGDVKYTDEKSLELLSRYQTFGNYLEDGVTGIGHDAGPARFGAGDVAFMPTGSWQGGPVDEAATFEWTYMPFPGSDNAEDNQLLFGKYDMSWMVAEDSSNKEAALAYVAALSDPVEYNSFANTVGLIPTQETATLETKLGEEVAMWLPNFRVAFEQYFVQPQGAGERANVFLFGASWFAPFDEFTDPAELAETAQADLDAGLNA
jgi:raffinose/stachyose/melibiose transport system substrate-binding protein